MNPETPKPDATTPALEPPPDHRIVLNSNDLFCGQREIDLEHEGVCYRLRITRRNKLILQK